MHPRTPAHTGLGVLPVPPSPGFRGDNPAPPRVRCATGEYFLKNEAHAQELAGAEANLCGNRPESRLTCFSAIARGWRARPIQKLTQELRDDRKGEKIVHLEEISVQVVQLPLSTPFRTSLRQVTAVEDVRVTLVAESGVKGVGSASPTAAITGESTQGIAAAMEDYIGPLLRQTDLHDRNHAYQTVQKALQHNSSAKAAVDIALHDLYAREDGVSLLRHLGGSPGPLPTDATVSLADPEAMERQALSLTAQGFSQLKIKLGGKDGQDRARVRRIREGAGPGVRLWVDPNQAWSVRETLRHAEAIAPYDVEFIEQPLPARDLEGMAEVRRLSALPICADEAVYGPDDLRRVMDLRAADILNVKLMKAGGLTQAALLLSWAQAGGMMLMVGSMMEGPASVSAAAALAQAFHCPYVDLDAGYFLQNARAAGGIGYDRGMIHFPAGPGLGIIWDGDEGGLA